MTADGRQMNANNRAYAPAPYVATVEQSFGYTRCTVFCSSTGKIVAQHKVTISAWGRTDGWMEQDPNELYESVLTCMKEVATQLLLAPLPKENIIGISLANQRETVIAWDGRTGKNLTQALTWKDTRGMDILKLLKNKSSRRTARAIRHKTGLHLHSCYSAWKMRWILENVKEAIEVGDSLKFGTVDSWLIWRLTGGPFSGIHVTDVTNASRTLLFSIHSLQWDEELCSFFGIKMLSLARVVSSAEKIGTIKERDCSLKGRLLCGLLAEQQAALVAQTWWDPINIEELTADSVLNVRLGLDSSAFIMLNIGRKAHISSAGLMTTLSCKLGPNADAIYAIEGSIANAGSALDWMKDNLKLFSSLSEAELLVTQSLNRAKQVESKSDLTAQSTRETLCDAVIFNHSFDLKSIIRGWFSRLHAKPSSRMPNQSLGSCLNPSDELDQRNTGYDPCYFVPAFGGLLCPYWRSDARGLIAGLTETCGRIDLILAGFRACAYQVDDVLQTISDVLCKKSMFGSVAKPRFRILVDGGLANSDFLIQNIADITGCEVVRNRNSEMAVSIGAAVAALIATGLDPEGVFQSWHQPSDKLNYSIFSPKSDEIARNAWIMGWRNTVLRSVSWFPNLGDSIDSPVMVQTNTQPQPAIQRQKLIYFPNNASLTEKIIWIFIGLLIGWIFTHITRYNF